MGNQRSEEIYHSLDEAVTHIFGPAARITGRVPVHGGDINRAYKLQISTGFDIFIKENSISNIDFFLTEERGLHALRCTGQIGVPHNMGSGIDRGRNISFLFMEYIESAPRIASYWETFGHQLAALHRAECQSWVGAQDGGVKYGFLEDNFIGATPQKNRPCGSWIDFYRDCRLLPQITRAERYFDSAVLKKADRLLNHLDVFLREPEFPSLLHGDLWSGNIVCGPNGRAWIIDPAACVGDFEADLAMTQLFGSLPDEFYSAYSEVNPIDKAGYSQRRGLYDLYHLLNHLNLFGSSYLGSVVNIINRYSRLI